MTGSYWKRSEIQSLDLTCQKEPRHFILIRVLPTLLKCINSKQSLKSRFQVYHIYLFILKNGNFIFFLSRKARSKRRLLLLVSNHGNPPLPPPPCSKLNNCIRVYCLAFLSLSQPKSSLLQSRFSIQSPSLALLCLFISSLFVFSHSFTPPFSRPPHPHHLSVSHTDCFVGILASQTLHPPSALLHCPADLLKYYGCSPTHTITHPHTLYTGASYPRVFIFQSFHCTSLSLIMTPLF